MSWIQKLYETYDACAGNETIPDYFELCPIGYSTQNAHIEIVIDNNGNFRRATLVDKKSAKTLIPVTEKSLTGRTSGIAPYPLCDSLQYCAGDYTKFGGLRESYFEQCTFNTKGKEFADKNLKPINLINAILQKDNKSSKKGWSTEKSVRWLNFYLSLVSIKSILDIENRKRFNRDALDNKYPDLCPRNEASYMLQLQRWANSPFSHPKVEAVYKYLAKKSVIDDIQDLLCFENCKLFVANKGVVSPLDSHKLMKLLNFDEKDKKDQAKAFVRWVVEGDNLNDKTWKDSSLFKAWADYLNSKINTASFCCVTGKDASISELHPTVVGKAKIISSNDTSGFTYLGRFLLAKEAVTISTEVSQKAHSALKWLIGRKQAFRSDSMIYISWAKTGKQIPDPCANSWSFLGEEAEPVEAKEVYVGDVGQSFAERFKKKLAGYKTNISDTEDIIVMGLDSATPGRMAITFYRELAGSEFLARIENWHSDFAWLQNFSKDVKFTGSPAPKDIAWCAYGNKAEGKNGIKLLNATVERILPCIIDGRVLPRDLVELCVHRTSNRAGLEKDKKKYEWEFEKCLGIVCSIFKGYHKNKMEYQMALEEERNTRDYLYGRLLAVAERIESMALIYAKEKRETTAARLMQRFSDRPFSTWKTIENSLAPYKSRINSKAPGLLNGFMALLDEIIAMFQTDEFILDNRLSGEYLLGYHCQRKWLKEHKVEKGQWILKAADESDTAEAETEDLELNIN